MFVKSRWAYSLKRMIQLSSHKLQLEVDRSVIEHEIPREVDSLGVAELTETRRCVEIE